MTNQTSTIILSACLGVAAVAVTALPVLNASAEDISGTTTHKHHSRKKPSNETGNTASDRDNAMGTTNTSVPPGDIVGVANTASPTTRPSGR
jgi:hypothetical protein